jgi:hypothetical protein
MRSSTLALVAVVKLGRTAMRNRVIGLARTRRSFAILAAIVMQGCLGDVQQCAIVWTLPDSSHAATQISQSLAASNGLSSPSIVGINSVTVG